MSATLIAEVLSAISRAKVRAAGSKSSGLTTRLTRCPASASSAGNTRPENTHSAAWLMPTTRGRNQLEQASGTMPRRANTKPMRAALEAMRTSIASVMVTPMPTAGPLIAAITGFLQSYSRSVSSPPPSRASAGDSFRP